MMRIRLLGPIDVLVDGAVRPVGGVRRAALLATLALARGEAVSTDRLADVLWADEPPATPLNTIQSHVSQLRRLLGNRDAIVPCPPGYRLDAEVDTDVALAERLIAGGRVQQLREALALWRGPALAEVAGLPWLAEQAQRLEQLRVHATRALIEARLALGEHTQVLPELTDLAAAHPFDEQVHGLLMLALYRSGRQADALAAYRRLGRVLDDELAIAPGQPLRDLEAAILRQDPALDPPTAAVDAGALVEREPAQMSLVECVTAARKGDGRLVLIAGEAGAGKTALIEWLHGYVPEARWSWSACDGLFTPQPLGPLFDLAERLDGPLLELCRAGADRDALFRALLRAVSEPPGLDVVVVEDVHWADEATLDLLRFLGRRLRGATTLVIATYRDDGLTADHPLRVALGDLATRRSTRRIDLEPLSPAAVEELAGGTGLEASALYRLTGGNPFYVTEVLRAGMDEVPASARDVVLSRVASLSGPAREALDAAALTGTRVDVALLEAIAGCQPSAVDELVTGGLLVGDGDGLRFRHEIARRAVAHAVAGHRNRSIHRRALAALCAFECSDEARLAFHAEAAGDAAAVLRYAPAAARRAANLGAHREAAAQYERALRFAGEAGPATRAALHDELAVEVALLDRWDDAAEAGERALVLWRETGDRVREGDTLRRLTRIRWNLCQGREAVAAAEEAVAILEQSGPGVELAWAYATFANLRMLRAEHGPAMTLARQAKELAERLGALAVLSDALNTYAVSASVTGRPWVANMRQSLDIALTGGFQDQAARAYANFIGTHLANHEFAEAERYLDEGTAYCEEYDLTTYHICLRSFRANFLERVGRWDEATRLSTELLRTAGPSPVNRLCTLIRLGAIKARRGEPDAWAYLDEAAELADGTDEPQQVVPTRLARAEARWLAGDLGGAAREAELAASVCGGSDGWDRGAVAVWLRRTGSALPVPGHLAEPHRLYLDGYPAKAAEVWSGLGCPYDAALALAEVGDEPSRRAALSAFTELGAAPAARRLQR